MQVSLAGVGQWLRGLGRCAVVPGALAPALPEALAPWLETTDSGYGRLQSLRHAVQFSATPAGWRLPSLPPGSHPPAWARAKSARR